MSVRHSSIQRYRPPRRTCRSETNAFPSATQVRTESHRELVDTCDTGPLLRSFSILEASVWPAQRPLLTSISVLMCTIWFSIDERAATNHLCERQGLPKRHPLHSYRCNGIGPSRSRDGVSSDRRGWPQLTHRYGPGNPLSSPLDTGTNATSRPVAFWRDKRNVRTGAVWDRDVYAC